MMYSISKHTTYNDSSTTHRLKLVVKSKTTKVQFITMELQQTGINTVQWYLRIFYISKHTTYNDSSTTHRLKLVVKSNPGCPLKALKFLLNCYYLNPFTHFRYDFTYILRVNYQLFNLYWLGSESLTISCKSYSYASQTTINWQL